MSNPAVTVAILRLRQWAGLDLREPEAILVAPVPLPRPRATACPGLDSPNPSQGFPGPLIEVGHE